MVSFLKDYPVKFYKQRIIDAYIVDFYCASAKLVIELDGSQHYSEEGIANDLTRSRVLQAHGLQILRFSNSEVHNQFQAVCEQIDLVVKQKTAKRT